MRTPPTVVGAGVVAHGLTSRRLSVPPAATVAGLIDRSNFSRILKKYLPAATHSQHLLDSLFAMMDSDKDGCIQYCEFVVGLSHVLSFDIDDRLHFLFSSFDTDKSGTLVSGGGLLSLVTLLTTLCCVVLCDVRVRRSLWKSWTCWKPV